MEATAQQLEMFELGQESRWHRARSAIAQFLAAKREHGEIIPRSMVSGFLGVSQQRVSQLVMEDRIPTVEVGGISWVPLDGLTKFCSEERKVGRPVHIPDTFSEFRRNLKNSSK
jgi:hypothetical protein